MVSTRSLFIGLALALASAPGRSQDPVELVPHPEWARPFPFASDFLETPFPPELQRCSPRVWREGYWSGIEKIHPRWFCSSSLSGTLAVEPHAAGLPTGLHAVFDVDHVFAPAIPANYDAALITGMRGRTSVIRQMVVLREKGPCRAWIYDLPSGVFALSGEIFLKAGYSGTTLYVLEGVAPKVIRFLDTDGDCLPDTRDPSFSVTTDGSFPSIHAFYRDPWREFEVILDNGLCTRPYCNGIEEVNGVYRFARRKPPRWNVLPATRPSSR